MNKWIEKVQAQTTIKGVQDHNFNMLNKLSPDMGEGATIPAANISFTKDQEAQMIPRVKLKVNLVKSMILL